MKTKKLKPESKFGEFSIVFEKLEEAMLMEKANPEYFEVDYSEINENIEALKGFQQEIDFSIYSYYTRS